MAAPNSATSVKLSDRAISDMNRVEQEVFERVNVHLQNRGGDAMKEFMRAFTHDQDAWDKNWAAKNNLPDHQWLQQLGQAERGLFNFDNMTPFQILGRIVEIMTMRYRSAHLSLAFTRVADNFFGALEKDEFNHMMTNLKNIPEVKPAKE